VIVALSVAKTHLVAARLRERWADEATPPLVMLLGAAPEMHLGLQRRAPEWVQRAGLEWLHRLAGDPRRLAKRYLVDDVRFVSIVRRERRDRRRRRPPG
jgi:N-acetylglucosaminyldiphosphoundecaprenol N-acetyl-beta-D-mannosaminyltransferase